MTRFMLAAGAAALAIMSPALAQKGDKGGDKGKGGQSAKVERGGGGGQKADRGQRGGGQAKADRGPQREQRMKVAKQEDRGPQKARDHHDDRRGPKMDKRGGGDDRVVMRGRDKERDEVIRRDRRDDRDDREVRVARFDRDDDDGFRFVPRWNDRGLVRGFNDGCPPGLDKKDNGCMPPGLAKKVVGTSLAGLTGLSALDGPYRAWYRDNDDYMYRWDDDYIYRVNRDGGLIDALFPYANRDYYYYPVGMSYPMDYNYYNVPYQYQSFYPDGGDYWYRYGDGAIYQVDPSNGMISGIAALLTGNPFAVGQPLPPAYGVYNVPLGYRDQYFDTADNWYRYNDGYIYRVDPTTQLITAVINALV